jgi:hypothetical protein
LTEMETWGPGEPPFPEPVHPVGNLAWNAGQEEHPQIRASFTGPASAPQQVQDGRIAPTRYSRNRWTAQDSPNSQDWLEVDFGTPKEVGRVDVFLLADGRDLTPPRSIRVERQTSDGWREIDPTGVEPPSPTPWAWNTITFHPVETERIRVNFRHAPSGFTGVSELRVWPPQ